MSTTGFSPRFFHPMCGSSSWLAAGHQHGASVRSARSEATPATDGYRRQRQVVSTGCAEACPGWHGTWGSGAADSTARPEWRPRWPSTTSVALVPYLVGLRRGAASSRSARTDRESDRRVRAAPFSARYFAVLAARDGHTAQLAGLRRGQPPAPGGRRLAPRRSAPSHQLLGLYAEPAWPRPSSEKVARCGALRKVRRARPRHVFPAAGRLRAAATPPESPEAAGRR